MKKIDSRKLIIIIVALIFIIGSVVGMYYYVDTKLIETTVYETSQSHEFPHTVSQLR